jgi:hypothetical protein
MVKMPANWHVMELRDRMDKKDDRSGAQGELEFCRTGEVISPFNY